MATINQLSTINTLVGSDQVPVYSSQNGDARKASMDTVKSFVALAVDAQIDNLQNQIDNLGADDIEYTPAGTGAVATTVQSKLREFVSVKDFGASPSASAAVNTAAIQAAIDHVFGLGGGEVFIPAGSYNISASASTESWETLDSGGATIPVAAGSCCLILRQGVYLRGAGMYATTLLMPTNTNLDAIYVSGVCRGYGIADLTVDGNWDLSTEVNSHGIFWVTPTIAGESACVFSDGVIRNVQVTRVSSYGFGLQHGQFLNNLFDNIRVVLCGADGLDAKNRIGNRGNRIENAVISAFGLRPSLLLQTGIDVRGEAWSIISPRVINFGRVDTVLTGIRFNPGVSSGAAGVEAKESFISNCYIEATNLNTTGIQSYGPNCTISSGAVVGCGVYGVFNRANADANGEDNTIVGVTVDGRGTTTGAAFISESSAIYRTRWIGCSAKSCDVGFRPAGNDEVIVGCSVASDVTQPLLTNMGVVNLTVEASPTVVQNREQGTWTPVFAPSTGSFATMTIQTIYAEYIRDYNKVTCNAYLRTNNVDITGGSGSLILTGLPFASKAGSYAACSLSELTGWSANPPVSGYVFPGASSVAFYSITPATGVSAATPVSALFTGVSSAKNRMIISFTYFIS